MKKITLFICIAIAMFSFVGTAQAGSGTQADPYTCAELLELSSGSNIWVVGYITGAHNTEFGMLLADDVNGTSEIAVKLQDNTYRDVLNPIRKPDCLLKKVKICGKRGSYVSKQGLESISDYEFVEADSSTPAITADPTALDFGSAEIDDVVAAQTITLAAENLTDDVILSFETSENNPFSVESTTISAADADGATVSVALNTDAAGTYANKLIFTHDGVALAEVDLAAVVTDPNAALVTVETFDNLDEGSSYASTGSFVGVNGITWTYKLSRGDQKVTGTAITFKKDDKACLSATIPGGCGVISFNYKKPFSGEVNMDLKINEQSWNFTSSDSDVHNSGDIKVNVEGDFKISFVQKGERVSIDDITWTSYGAAPAVAKPTIAVTGDPQVDASVSVALACDTENSVIYYTTDGTDPTTSSDVYDAAFAVTTTTTVKALAEVGGDVSAIAEEVIEFPASVATIAEFLALEVGTEMKITGAVNILFAYGKYMYVQDASAWTLIYGSSNWDEKYAAGKTLTGLVATLGEHNGAKQLTDAVLPEPADGEVVDPYTTTYAALTDADMHRLVTLEALTVKSDVTFSTNTTVNGTVTEGATDFMVRTNYRVIDMVLKAGDVIDVTGFVGVYDSKLQIYPIAIQESISTSVDAVVLANKVYAVAGAIRVNSDEMAKVTVLDMTGKLVAMQMVEGSAQIAVEDGMYLVKVNDAVSKVVVR